MMKFLAPQGCFFSVWKKRNARRLKLEEELLDLIGGGNYHGCRQQLLPVSELGVDHWAIDVL